MTAYNVRRHSLPALGCALLLAVIAPAAAQSVAWKPEKNVEIVTGTGAGGSNEAAARLLQRLFREHRLVVPTTSVVTKPGDGSAIAETYLNRHPGDGHYLALSTPTLLTNRLKDGGSLAHNDVTPITNLFSEYILMAVRIDSPIKTGKDLAERLRAGDPAVSVGISSAFGNHIHIATALVARSAAGDSRKLRVVLYDNGPKAAAAAVSGHVDMVSASAGALLPEMQSGRLRLLGLTAPRRLGGPLAGVPTWKEQGVDAVYSSWRGIVGPRGMSVAQVAYWEDVFLKLAFTDEWLDELRKRSWDSTYLNSSETRKFLEDQSALMKGVLSDLGLIEFNEPGKVAK